MICLCAESLSNQTILQLRLMWFLRLYLLKRFHVFVFFDSTLTQNDSMPKTMFIPQKKKLLQPLRKATSKAWIDLTLGCCVSNEIATLGVDFAVFNMTSWLSPQKAEFQCQFGLDLPVCNFQTVSPKQSVLNSCCHSCTVAMWPNCTNCKFWFFVP